MPLRKSRTSPKWGDTSSETTLISGYILIYPTINFKSIQRSDLCGSRTEELYRRINYRGHRKILQNQIWDHQCLQIYYKTTRTNFHVDPTVGSSQIVNRKNVSTRKYLDYRKILRNLIWDHSMSPDYLSTTHINYKVDRTVGSSQIREPRTESTIR